MHLLYLWFKVIVSVSHHMHLCYVCVFTWGHSIDGPLLPDDVLLQPPLQGEPPPLLRLPSSLCLLELGGGNKSRTYREQMNSKRILKRREAFWGWGGEMKWENFTESAGVRDSLLLSLFIITFSSLLLLPDLQLILTMRHWSKQRVCSWKINSATLPSVGLWLNASTHYYSTNMSLFLFFGLITK